MATDQINCMEEFLAQSTQINVVELDKEIEVKQTLASIWVTVRASCGYGWQYLPPLSPAWLLKKETLPLSVTWSSLDHKYVAPVWGGGGERETNHAKSVHESLSAAWLDSQDGHGWETWVYVFRSDYSRKTKRKEKVNIFQTLHASLCKAKRV